MGIQTFKAKVSEHRYLTPKYQHLDLELVAPARLEFAAGQYVMLKVPGEDRLRQYSIASPPSLNHAIELLVDVIPHGKGSQYLASLKPGDEVEFLAPAGRFLISPEKKLEQELWFVATGSGIAPIRSMLLDLLIDQKDQRPIWLHWGLRYTEDIFWFDDWAQLAEEQSNFTFDLALSRPPEDWQLCQGHTTGCVFQHHGRFDHVGVYLCGNKKMIFELRQKLLARGLDQSRIHTEQFYDL